MERTDRKPSLQPEQPWRLHARNDNGACEMPVHIGVLVRHRMAELMLAWAIGRRDG